MNHEILAAFDRLCNDFDVPDNEDYYLVRNHLKNCETCEGDGTIPAIVNGAVEDIDCPDCGSYQPCRKHDFL